MKRERFGTSMRLVAVVFGLSLVAAACGDDGDDTDEGATGADDAAAAECDAVRVGLVPGWDEGEAVTHLWSVLLAEKGSEVEVTELDAGPLYQGLAQDDLDVFMDAWLPVTHEDYWAEFGGELEDLGVWYDKATLNLAVPEYVDAESIADLTGNAAEFDGRIVGIDPGAGLMRVTQDEVIPTYGLDDFELVEGSSIAMLTELERAIDDEEPIVVTLWHPHWAYSKFPLKDLTDPEGAMGEAEEMHTVARNGFTEECGDIAGWFSNMQMDDESLGSLEQLMFDQFEDGQEEEAVNEWLSDEANRELVDGWMS